MSALATVMNFFNHRRTSDRPTMDTLRERELAAERAVARELSKLRSTRLKFDTRPNAEKTGEDLLNEVDENDDTMREAFGG